MMFKSINNAMTAGFVKLQTAIEEFKNDEQGVTAIEYALVGVAIATAVAAVFGTDGGDLNTGLTNAMSTITGKLPASE